MDHDMLAAIGRSTSTKTRRLVVKCAATANAAGANITVKNVNTKVILPLLETFATKHGQDSLTCDIIVDSWSEQAYTEVLGEVLGPQVWLKAQQQQAQIATETALATACQPATAEPPINELEGDNASMRPPKEVVVTTVDNQSERDDFLSQCAQSEVTSATDHLKQLFETRLATGGDYQEVMDMITQRAVQQALAQAAVDLPLKRKVRHTYDDDASTLVSVQETGTHKRMFFPTMKAPAGRSRTALGPPALRNARGGERFDPAALLGRRMTQSDLRENPANKSSLPAASYVEKEWMAITAGVHMQASVQDDFLPVTKTSSFLTEELLPQAANMLQHF